MAHVPAISVAMNPDTISRKLNPYRYVNRGGCNCDLGRSLLPISALKMEMYITKPISISNPATNNKLRSAEVILKSNIANLSVSKN
jgi:hypothetical protein